MATVRVALAQIAPVLLDRKATLAKVEARVREAGERGAALVAFGECLVPGYPVWVERIDGARFDADEVKAMHALSLEQAVTIEDGHLRGACAAAREAGVTVVLGILERPRDRGGHSAYASCVVVDARGRIASVHRKLVPTHEERLTWSPGDGAGLVTHPVGPFTLGALNCWENWMPLARAALLCAGEDLHVAIWPGAERNTRDVTRFAAREGRSFVLAASGLLRDEDVPAGLPLRERIVREPGEVLRDGGSCVAGPDGRFVVEPVVGREALIVAELDPAAVRRERQTFDAVGHSARPDVLRLVVDRRRQAAVEWRDA